jgi:hypothetical protein
MKNIKGKGIVTMLFLISVDSNMGDNFICFLSAVLRLLHGLLFPEVKKKSDTAVALRRGISIIPCE